MFTITALLVLFTTYLGLTLLAHGSERFLVHRLALLAGLIALATITLTRQMLA
jgi:hypothetical protein